MVALPENAWSRPVGEVLGGLDVVPEQGLDEGEARRRLAGFGENRLRRIRRRSVWRIVRDQFASLIVALLAAAAAVAFAVGEIVEGGAILAVIVINAAIGFVTERRALRSMEALRELGHARTTVRRDGQVRSVLAQALVPGDIVILEAGDVLTADVRLVQASRLQVDEAALTGESLPVDKHCEPVASVAAVDERSCMLFKGTALTRGAGEAVVVATGMSTQLGQISSLVEEAEPQTTPLERRLDVLARRLVGVTVAIAAVVGVVVLASGRDLYFAVEIAIALAVATIPEGLPIVATVALARGMWRMARRNALVEQLSAVETLGSTTVILTDKTGTLTENRMTAVEFELADGRIDVTGTGLDVQGEFREHGIERPLRDSPALAEVLRCAVLCNNASVEAGEGGELRASGDPTEVALLVAGLKAGLTRAALVREYEEVTEIAFDAETQRMATVHRHAGGLLAAVKGSPEAIVPLCSHLRSGDGRSGLDDTGRQVWLERAEAMAATGQRVLALASGAVASADGFAFEGLTLLGLVGLFDPPRERVRGAVDACQAAGIRVVMVTGDHGATAWTVAAAVGLIDPRPGQAMDYVDARRHAATSMLDPAVAGRMLAAPVIARASPRQKLQLIELHQQQGAVVAMTGDGVNDAPALKKADIGIAMGLRGTQVAREAADMVLRDDELDTIVTAVAQGRAIVANIRKFVIYLMSCNVSEILAVALGVVAQGPLPILPLQILFLNLVTDVFPALALGVCEGSPGMMREPPRPPREPILTPGRWRAIFLHGGVIALSVLAALGLAVVWLDTSPEAATTISFLALALAQLWHVFNVRSTASRFLDNEVTRNPWIWGALALCLVLLLLAVYWAPLAGVLSLTDPGPAGWLLALVLSLVPLLVGQGLLWRLRGGAPGDAA
jgi:Ca2+-transporting ATPase